MWPGTPKSVTFADKPARLGLGASHALKVANHYPTENRPGSSSNLSKQILNKQTNTVVQNPVERKTASLATRRTRKTSPTERVTLSGRRSSGLSRHTCAATLNGTLHIKRIIRQSAHLYNNNNNNNVNLSCAHRRGALSAHMMHILNTIFNTHVEHRPTRK